MNDTNEPELFELYWENSKLNDSNIREFSARINEYYSQGMQKDAFHFPVKDSPLPMPRDRLQKTMQDRRSHRSFADKPLATKQLGNLFAAFAASPHGTRVFPSAGSTYAVEVFCLLNNIKGDLNGKTVYYNADNHSVSVIGEAPDPKTLDTLLNLDTAGTIPPAVFILTILSHRTTSKYGERGGRFALIELGHAAQNLALRLARENLAGVEIGGLMDEKIAKILGIDKYPVKVALGYACGVPGKV